jgi:hypothetical protein
LTFALALTLALPLALTLPLALSLPLPLALTLRLGRSSLGGSGRGDCLRSGNGLRGLEWRGGYEAFA